MFFLFHSHSKKIKQFFLLFSLLHSIGLSDSEVDVRRLTKSEGIYFLKGSNDPYNGIAYKESNINDQRILEFNIENGEKNDYHHEWYLNGKKKNVFHYKNYLFSYLLQHIQN